MNLEYLHKYWHVLVLSQDIAYYTQPHCTINSLNSFNVNINHFERIKSIHSFTHFVGSNAFLLQQNAYPHSILQHHRWRRLILHTVKPKPYTYILHTNEHSPEVTSATYKCSVNPIHFEGFACQINCSVVGYVGFYNGDGDGGCWASDMYNTSHGCWFAPVLFTDLKRFLFFSLFILRVYHCYRETVK